MNNGLTAWFAALFGASVATGTPAVDEAPDASLSAAPTVETTVAYETAEVTATGTVSGTITTAAAASTGTLPVTQDNPVCGDSVPDETVLVVDGKLANAVVWIDGLQSGAAVEAAEVTLDQKGCTYVPHVQAVPKNSNLTVVNSDAVLHNSHSYLEGTRTIFNLAMPEKDQRIARPLRKSGLVDVKCDAGHTWMSAYIWVFDHPYYATTGEDGTFTLEGVPAGTHTLKVWHETLGEKTTEITVDADGSVTADLTL